MVARLIRLSAPANPVQEPDSSARLPNPRPFFNSGFYQQTRFGLESIIAEILPKT